MATKKPSLSFWQIWNMSFGFLGIQFGFALQNANVSRIFETLGGDVGKLSLYWLAAPITGLIVQPIIGHYSDKTWNRLGRRRPYFLVGAILATLALLFMPNSPTLWIAVGTLWIMDASINISMEPFRAYVGDMLPPEQRTMGFSMQSFFIGIGAVVASVLPWVLKNWFDVTDDNGSQEVPLNVHYAFYIGGAVFLLAVLWTVIRSREYSPEQMKSFEPENADPEGKDKPETDELSLVKRIRQSFRIGSILIFMGVLFILGFFYFLSQDKIDEEVSILAFGLLTFGIFEIIAGILLRAKRKSGFTEIISDLNRMPKTMRQLAFVQFFSWFALFAMWIYTTSGVTSSKYDMKLDKKTNTELIASIDSVKNIPDEKGWKNINEVREDLKEFDTRFSEGKEVTATVRVVKFFSDTTKHAILDLPDATKGRVQTIMDEYNDGADWVGVLMGVYNGFAAIMAFLLMWMARRIKRKYVHSISLVIGGISFASFFFISNPNMLVISELGIGLAWASILAIPYAILTGSLPSHKMGVYMGIFNFFIVIPQIVAASILGNLIKYFFDGQPIYALVIGGFSLLIAALLVLFVQDKE